MQFNVGTAKANLNRKYFQWLANGAFRVFPDNVLDFLPPKKPVCRVLRKDPGSPYVQSIETDNSITRYSVKHACAKRSG